LQQKSAALPKTACAIVVWPEPLVVAGPGSHLDALLEIEELDAIQWTPGVGQPQGGDPGWYDLYKRILAGGKSIMPAWVEVDELQPLLDAVGAEGVNILMHFNDEQEIDRALEIAAQYR